MGMRIPHQTLMYVEKNPFCQSVLQKRMEDGDLQQAPVFSDVGNLTADDVASMRVTHIFAGFPCQDISCIGRRRGVTDDTRSGLLLAILGLAQSAKVPWLFLENVAAIRKDRAIWEQVMGALHACGYDAIWTMVSARDVGAPHCRDRWFALCRRRPDGAAASQFMPAHVAPPEGKMINGLCTATALWHPRPRPTVPRVRLVAPADQSNTMFNNLPEQRQSGCCWATPRTNCGCARTLTPRCSRDLGTQLRFASTTPADHAAFGMAGIVVDVGYLEWLMGLPQGWTHPSASMESDRRSDWKSRSGHMHWEFEPPNRRIGPRRSMHMAAKRHQALGNACVPFCAEKAWDVLRTAWANIDEPPDFTGIATTQTQVPRSVP